MDAVAVFCCAVSVLVFSNTWQGDFVYDDRRAIVKNEDLRSTTAWSDLWTHDFWGTPLDHSGSHKSWRPLCVLSFRINYYLTGLNASSYHSVNIALHGLVTLMLTQFMRPMIRQRWIRCATGLAFAVHPIHCEAVASIVGRAELGMAFHVLLALLAYQRYIKLRTSSSSSRNISRTASNKDRGDENTEIGGGEWKRWVYLTVSVSFAVTAIFWKESGMAAVPLCALLELNSAFVKKRSPCNEPPPQQHPFLLGRAISSQKCLWNLIVLGGASTVQVALRLYMLSGGMPTFAAADNPMAHEDSLLTRTLTLLYLPVFNVALLLWPWRLSFDWSMDAVAPISKWSDPRNAATLSFYALVALVVVRTNCNWNCNWHRFQALALAVIPFIPASNLFFYVGFVVAERVLYLPSVGFCLFLGYGLDNLSRTASCRLRQLIRLSFGTVLILWSLRTIQRNQDWCHEEQLYRSGIAINPAKAYGNLAAILAADQRQTEAEYAYRQALKHRPNMAETHFNLAVLLQNQGRYQEASSSYLRSIHYRPNLALAYLNLGSLLSKQGRYEQAVHWLKSCSQLDVNGLRDPQTQRQSQIAALLQWGQLEINQANYRQAIQLYKQALHRSPNHHQLQMVYRSLGEVYQQTGDFGESDRWYRMAIEVKPYDVTSHLTYARLLAKNASRHDEAEQLFRQAQMLAPSDPSVYMMTGQFFVDVSRLHEGAESFVRAAHLAPDDFEAVFNAATTLREIKEMDRAEHFYRLAVRLRPNVTLLLTSITSVMLDTCRLGASVWNLFS